MTEFKRSMVVFIPGRVVETTGSGKVIVETAFGNTVVERSSDLELAASYAGSTEERTERLARAMCGADSIDPDERAYIGQPLLVGSGYVAPSGMFEAWRLYAKYAQALIDKGLA